MAATDVEIRAAERRVGEDTGSESPGRCMNCGAALSGPFCARCGQRDADLRRPFFSIVREFADDVLSFDSRVVRTLVTLFLRPGKVSREYADNARARYVPPVRLVLISVLLFFLALEVTDVALVHLKRVPLGEGDRAPFQISVPEEAASDEAGVLEGERERNYALTIALFVPVREAATDPVLSEKDLAEFQEEIAKQRQRNSGSSAFVDFMERVVFGFNRAVQTPAALNTVFNTWLPRAMLLLVPVFALVLRMFHWGRSQYFFNQLVFSLHFHAFLFGLLTLLVLLSAVGLGVASGPLYLVATPLYFLLAMKRFYRQGWFRTAIKFLVVSAIYNLVLLVTLLAIVLTGLMTV